MNDCVAIGNVTDGHVEARPVLVECLEITNLLKKRRASTSNDICATIRDTSIGARLRLNDCEQKQIEKISAILYSQYPDFQYQLDLRYRTLMSRHIVRRYYSKHSMDTD